MKTTNSFNHPVFAYILNCIDSQYAEELGMKIPETEQEQLQYVVDVFKAEQSYSIKREGIYKSFENWLMGLPAVINIDFENYKILEFGYIWEGIDKDLKGAKKEKREELIINNWFNWITVKFFRLCNHYKVTY